MYRKTARFPEQAGALFVFAHALLVLAVSNSLAQSGIL